MNLRYTHHALKRIKERGITNATIDLTLEYGEIDQDAYEISSTIADQYIKSLQYEKQLIEQRLRYLKKVRDKGGVRSIIVSEHIITAYNSNSRRNAY